MQLEISGGLHVKVDSMEIEIATALILILVVLASFALYIHQQNNDILHEVCIVILQLASVALFVLGKFVFPFCWRKNLMNLSNSSVLEFFD